MRSRNNKKKFSIGDFLISMYLYHKFLENDYRINKGLRL